MATDGGVRHVPLFCRHSKRNASLEWLVPIAKDEHVVAAGLLELLEQSFGAGFRAYALDTVVESKPTRQEYRSLPAIAGWQPPLSGHCAALLGVPGWVTIDAEKHALATQLGVFPTNVRVLDLLSSAARDQSSVEARALQWLMSTLREMSSKTRPLKDEDDLRQHVVGAFAIDNPRLLEDFVETRTELQRVGECGQRFQQWLQSPEGIVADHYLGEDGANHYRQKLHEESERIGGAPLPLTQCRGSFLLHGTSARAILPIIVQGFKLDSGHYLSARRDYFGIGTYFTDTLCYSLKYAPLHSSVMRERSSSFASSVARSASGRSQGGGDGGGDGPAWIPDNCHALFLSDVQWSNAYPCIENPITDKSAPFLEQDLKEGFNAHVALVVRPRQVNALKRRLVPGAGKGQNTWQPVDLRKHRPFGSEWAHEFVVRSNRGRALPLFVVFISDEFWKQMTSAQ